jgi:Protein of unknown function with HXXEE motif
MSRLGRALFLALIAAQAAHSVEEYLGRLYDVLAPAGFVSGLLSIDRRVGFVIFNASLVAIGLGCYLGPIRHARRSAAAIGWLWVVLELANGTAHVVWAAASGSYRPGLATAPALVGIALLLARDLRRGRTAPESAGLPGSGLA